MNKKYLSVLIALAFVLGIVGIAYANQGAFNDFNAKYPFNTIAGCTICHTQTGPPTNPYGSALKARGGTANNIPNSVFVAVENLDSDGDGATNIQEINAGFYPGDPTSTPPPVVDITSPISGDIVPSGALDFPITYSSAANVDSVKVKYSIDNGLTWLPAVEGTGSVLGSFSWDVPTLKKNKTQVRVKVIGFQGTLKVGADKSAAFTIETVSITAPAPGQVVTAGGPFTITWLTNGTSAAVDSFQLLYSTNNGTTYKPIFTAPAGTGNPGTFTWDPVATVPKAKPNSLIKLILKDATGNKVGTAVSSKFTIQ